MSFDLEDDRFDVTYELQKTTTTSLLETIQQLGYRPEVVEAPFAPEPAAAERIDLDQLPQEMASTFAQARRSNKSILIRFKGPG